MEWIGQGIGILAMAFNILSYQSKSARGVIFMQLFGGALFAISFLMLGQYVGGILNIIAAIRAILFYFKKQTKIDRAGWIPVFIASYLAVYAATFLVFNQQFTVKNCIIECLPVLGMTATTLAAMLGDDDSEIEGLSAEQMTDIMLMASAANSGLGANIEKKRAISIKSGAPGG